MANKHTPFDYTPKLRKPKVKRDYRTLIFLIALGWIMALLYGLGLLHHAGCLA